MRTAGGEQRRSAIGGRAERRRGAPIARRKVSPEQGMGGISQGTEKRAVLGGGGGRPEAVSL